MKAQRMLGLAIKALGACGVLAVIAGLTVSSGWLLVALILVACLVAGAEIRDDLGR